MDQESIRRAGSDSWLGFWMHYQFLRMSNVPFCPQPIHFPALQEFTFLAPSAISCSTMWPFSTSQGFEDLHLRALSPKRLLMKVHQTKCNWLIKQPRVF